MNPCAPALLVPMSVGLTSRYAGGTNPDRSLTVALNVDGKEADHYSRLAGWSQYGQDIPCFGNQDLHDQLARAINGTAPGPLPCSKDPSAEAITLLRSVTSHPSGTRRLIAATKSRVYAINDSEGTARILGHGYGGYCGSLASQAGCSEVRFKADTLGNYTILTNGVDDVLSWKFDEGPDEGETISLKRIADLVALGIRAARHVLAFEGFIILADFVEEGERQSSSLIWSDFNFPISFQPGGESLAGRMDLGRGERILGMAPLGGGWRLYTSRAIYHVTLVTDGRVFAFEEICSNMPTVAYPNSLVTNGDEHIWLGTDTMWMMGMIDRTPRRLDWLHQASGIIFNGINAKLVSGFPEAYGVVSFGTLNKTSCEQVVAWWDYHYECLWISWPAGTSRCPNKSMVLWPRTAKASIVDHGFTAGCVHQPYLAKSLRQVMDEMRVCPRIERLEPLESAGCVPSNTPIDFPSLYNSSKSSASPMDQNSAIAAFCNVCLPSYCQPCENEPRLLMASGADFTIKQFTPGTCVRTVMTGITGAQFPTESTGCYVEEGYTWLLQGAPRRVGYSMEQLIHSVGVVFTAADDLPYGVMESQIGMGDQPATMDWESADPVSLGPQDGGAADLLTWERSGADPIFNFHSVGYWSAWRLFGGGIGGCVSIGSVNINPGEC